MAPGSDKGGGETSPSPSTAASPSARPPHLLSPPAVPAVHAFAGASAGALATAVLHPLDLAKTRMQTLRPEEHARIEAKYGGGARWLDKVLGGAGRRRRREAGAASKARAHTTVSLRAQLRMAASRGPAGLFQGVTPSLAGSGLSWGLYFFGYEFMKRELVQLQRKRQRRKSEKGGDGRPDEPIVLGPVEHSVAALSSSVMTQLLTNPIWVLKTRMQLHGSTPVAGGGGGAGAGSSPPSVGNYRGVVSGLLTILREEGIRGWYVGLIPALAGTSHGMVQFAIYEELKRLLREHPSLLGRSNRSPSGDSDDGSAGDVGSGSGGATHPRPLNEVEIFAASSVSKVTAVCVTYPYQVVRARMHERPSAGSAAGDALSPQYKYDGVRHVLRVVWSEGGIRGFYAGLLPGILRVTPAGVLTLLAYEKFVQFGTRLLA
jgi:solute carrier family 25 (mitochondrial folate transporter), member 32